MTTGSILLLIVAMAYATVTDFRRGRIPNQLTFPMLGGGLVLRAITGGQDGLLDGMGGAGVALAMTILPFVMNWLGAGDVKLAMVIGVLMGSEFTFSALLYTAIVGGIIAVAHMIWRRKLMATLRYLFLFWYLPAPKDSSVKARFPYAPAMAAGSAMALFLSYQPSAVSFQLPAVNSQLTALSGQLLAVAGQALAAGLQVMVS